MEKILPEWATVLTDTKDEEPPQERLTDEQFEQALPVPVGHKLLLALPDVEETHNGILVKTKETIQNETVTSVVALVLDMGPDAYKDSSRFPSGPWCEVGNYVLIGPYKGQRFSLNGREFRIINDDCVEGVVKDPRGYRRI